MLIFSVYTVLIILISCLSDFSFKLSFINAMYLTRKEKTGQSYGRVSLTSC